MNPHTGEIVRFPNDMELEIEQKRRSQAGEAQLVKLRNEADPKCFKCYGRGHIGQNVTTGLFIPCTCCRE